MPLYGAGRTALQEREFPCPFTWKGQIENTQNKDLQKREYSTEQVQEVFMFASNLLYP